MNDKMRRRAAELSSIYGDTMEVTGREPSHELGFYEGFMTCAYELGSKIEHLERELWAARTEHFPNAAYDSIAAGKRRN